MRQEFTTVTLRAGEETGGRGVDKSATTQLPVPVRPYLPWTVRGMGPGDGSYLSEEFGKRTGLRLGEKGRDTGKGKSSPSESRTTTGLRFSRKTPVF